MHDATRQRAEGAVASRGAVALRLFLTCWGVYGLHFATNVVREHYPAFSLAERGTMRVDPYVGLHPDLFEISGRGAFIDGNPGASMFAAVPYALARPLVDRLVERVTRARAAQGEPLTAEYDDPRPLRREFFRKVRSQGLDVRFGLASWVMHAFCVAPLSAASAVVMRSVLLRAGFGPVAGLWLALLYAFGTPIFFRSGFLNQNLLVSHFALFGFALLFRPAAGTAPRAVAVALAGAAAGACVLCDYSGIVPLAALALYALAIGHRDPGVWRTSLAFGAGAAVPLAILGGYQAWAFGSPWFPAQHYMPATEFSVRGWNGMTWPEADLLWMNLFDLRFGLFAFCPLLALGIGAVVLPKEARGGFGGAELALTLVLFAGLWIFSSANQFGRLQWNTGVRYLVPAVPLLFVATAQVLTRLPRPLAVVLGCASVFLSWCEAMVREDVPQSLATVAHDGLRLPWLTVLGKMRGQYVAAFAHGPPDPLPWLIAAGIAIWLVWRPFPLVRLASGQPKR